MIGGKRGSAVLCVYLGGKKGGQLSLSPFIGRARTKKNITKNGGKKK
jgi:hypothetical protein